MKSLILSICLVLSAPAWAKNAAPQAQLPATVTAKLDAQSPANEDSEQYAPRAILLLSGVKDVVGVMPMVITVNGQNYLKYVPGPQIKESMDKGAKPIRLGDVLSALREATQSISKLQAENDALQKENEKLWKVAMKDSPQATEPPPTVIVQQPAPTQPGRLERYILLRSILPQPPQNVNVTFSNCTRYPALCVGR